MNENDNNTRLCIKTTQVKSPKYTGSCHKLNTYDWLNDIPETPVKPDLVEVRFKNTRKDFYRNSNQIRLRIGDLVAVEATPGHDIGIVSLTGELVTNQMKKCNIQVESDDFKKVYRKAKPADIEKWEEAIQLENSTMLKARKIAVDLNLEMKIGDVEYQGDKTKAIFYYIAEGRVDFRELIKVLAEEFKIRIEMRQIGARQEAGRIGGIGSCGRELCCSSWITNFVSVTTNAARYQELSLNPQKLAGQCGKLKCCLNYELGCYIDAQKDFPDTAVPIETEQGTAYHQKTDIFRRIMWYSYEKESSVNLIPVPVERVIQLLDLNIKGTKIPALTEQQRTTGNRIIDYGNRVGEDSLTRFDKKSETTGKKKKNVKKKRKGN
ncbi:MAG: hypothetical protein JSV24_04800 [Bacteroidales bacterium]|nr:MAG: hypothetical protein JSV24_04800 [Bacteroidales bacterium]